MTTSHAARIAFPVLVIFLSLLLEGCIQSSDEKYLRSPIIDENEDADNFAKSPIDESSPSDCEESQRLHAFTFPESECLRFSGATHVAIDSTGRISLVWAVQSAPEQQTMFVTISDDGGQSFSEPRIVAQSALFESVLTADGAGPFYTFPMSPHVIALDELIVLGWTQSVEKNETVCLMTIASDDGGQTFGKPVCVHQSVKSRPSFSSTAASSSRIAWSWLDFREQSLIPYASIRIRGEDDYRETPLAQLVPANMKLASDVAPCIGFDGNELLVAARVSDDNDSAIAILRIDTDGKVVDGPTLILRSDCNTLRAADAEFSLAVGGDEIYLAWSEVVKGEVRVRIVAADRKTLQATASVECPGTHCSQRHPQLAIDPQGSLHAVWEQADNEYFTSWDEQNPDDQTVHGRSQVMHAVWDAKLNAVRSPRFAHACTSSTQEQPSIAVSGEGSAIVSWNETSGDDRQVVVQCLP